MRSRRKQGGGNSGRKLIRYVDGKWFVCRDSKGNAIFMPRAPKRPSAWRDAARKQARSIAEATWAAARAEREARREALMRAQGGY